MKNILVAIALFVCAAAACADQAEIQYTLGMSQPQTHLFEVQVEFKNISQEQSLDLLLPV